MQTYRAPLRIEGHSPGGLGPAYRDTARRVGPARGCGYALMRGLDAALVPAQLQVQAFGVGRYIGQPPRGAADKAQVCGALISRCDYEAQPYQGAVTRRNQHYRWRTSYTAPGQYDSIGQHVGNFLTVYGEPIHNQIGSDRAVELVHMGSVDEHSGSDRAGRYRSCLLGGEQPVDDIAGKAHVAKALVERC